MVNNKYCFLIYNYEEQTPAAVFDTLEEVSRFLGTTKAVVSCGISRLKSEKIKYVRDKDGNKYQTYKIKL